MIKKKKLKKSIYAHQAKISKEDKHQDFSLHLLRYNVFFMYLIECVSWNHDHACFANGSFCKERIIKILKPLRCQSYEHSWAVLPFFAPPSYSDESSPLVY